MGRSLTEGVLIVALLGCGSPEPDLAPEKTPEASAPEVLASEQGARLDLSGFIQAPGRDLAVAHCTACHSGRLVQQNRATREGWHELIRWMQRKQGLWRLDRETEWGLLDYLSAHYGPLDESAGQASPRRLPLPRSLMPPVYEAVPAPNQAVGNV